MADSTSIVNEIAFEMAASSVRFGAGVTREVGMDLADLGVRTRAGRHRSSIWRGSHRCRRCSPRSTRPASKRCSTTACGSSPPTCRSATPSNSPPHNQIDGIVAVGGGSVIDTAKAVNLYTTYPPADFLDYVNAPIGRAMPVPGPLKPLIAIPTTAGTGSETTGVSIFDLTEMHAKTGIASRRLKPTLGLLDPENTRTMPRAGGGVERARHSEPCDRVVHGDAVYVAPAPASAARCVRRTRDRTRSATSGRLQALRIVAATSRPRRSRIRPTTKRAAQMMLAASYAGVGFGNAGVHLPHGMSYPVSGQVKDYRAPGYPGDHPLVPHGFSVILNAPAVFRFTAAANPARHLQAAEALGADVTRREAMPTPDGFSPTASPGSWSGSACPTG